MEFVIHPVVLELYKTTSAYFSFLNKRRIVNLVKFKSIWFYVEYFIKKKNKIFKTYLYNVATEEFKYDKCESHLR